MQELVEKHDSIQGRFEFFEAYAANSEFYLKVAKPLLTMGTVGSICTERRNKCIKDNIMTKKRNCLDNRKSVLLMPAKENLNHITRAQKIIIKKITGSLQLTCPCGRVCAKCSCTAHCSTH